MIIELDNFVSPDIVNYLSGKLRESKSIYGEANEYHRQGVTVTISKIPELAEVNNQLSKIFGKIKQTVREYYRPSYSGNSDTGYEYHLYEPGDVCELHSDSEIVAGVNELRYASVVLHLSTINNGGELVFPAQNQTVTTRAGKVVIFPPYGMFSHYTTPSTEAREVIVSWLTYDGVGIVKKGINITSNQGL